MENKKIALIIPKCTDLNRGDQALVYETAEVIKDTYNITDIYMMTSGDTSQCQREGLKVFKDILKHPSRFNTKNNNINYGMILKLKWGVVAVKDLIFSSLLLNKVTRKIGELFLDEEQKNSINLYKEAEVCFVKGGGFIHDYSGGLIGLYTMYYQLFHIILAHKLNKPVYIMPNSFGPFKSKICAKFVNKVLDKCKLVTARESISAGPKTNGLGRSIELYPDLAFFLKKNEEFDSRKYFENIGLSFERKYVAITVRPYRFSGHENPKEKYKKYKETFKDFILWLNTRGYFPILFVHTRAENDHENDEKCINEICQMINDNKKYVIIKDDRLSCRELKALYGNCKYIVGTRFHSVIFSVTQNVPAISITYGGNKGEGIMKDIDSNVYSIKIDELDFETLKSKFLKLTQSKESSLENINRYINNAIDNRNLLIEKIKKTM